MNTTDFLNIASAICPDREAIIFEGQRFTFSQLNDRVNRLANGLFSLGVKKGDRVAVLQVNCNQAVEAYFAVAKAGAIFLPLNFRAKGEELSYMLSHSETNTLLVGERYISLINTIRHNLPLLKIFISLDCHQAGMIPYEELLQNSSSEDVFTEIGDNDTTILMYTSGTTGFPKAVMLPHSSFVVYALENVTPAQAEGTAERNILSVPLYHVAGIQAMLAAIYGGRTIIMERQFEAREWMELVAKEKANRAMMVPTMLKQLLDHTDFGKYDLNSLKVITYGAAPMPLEVIKQAIGAFPSVNFINAFGQTETASTITALGPEDHVIAGTPAEREKKLQRLSSIGKPLSDVELKIVDDMGSTLPLRQAGEIVVRGPRIMSGYWKDKEKTEATIDKEGWVHTGDMGYADEDGYIFLTGRKTDMIKRGGERISPDEIEAVIRTHPAVEDVAVIGIPDVEWGEQIKACVVSKSGINCTETQIVDFCRDKIAGFKRPKWVIFVEALPRNPMGKVLRREVRQKYG